MRAADESVAQTSRRTAFAIDPGSCDVRTIRTCADPTRVRHPYFRFDWHLQTAAVHHVGYHADDFEPGVVSWIRGCFARRPHAAPDGIFAR